MDISSAMLTDKVAIVTGAGRGLGKGIARGLAAFGAKVVIAERKEEVAKQAEREVRERGQEALAIVCDVRDGEQVQRMVEQTVQEFGGVDILVNNVGGIYLGRGRPPSLPFLEQTEDYWDDSYTLNLKTVFHCTSAAAKVMVQQDRGGSIINIASSEALRCAPGFAPYAAYKAAMVNFTRTLALELAPHTIRVNCIAPDAIPTEGLAERFPELASDEAYRHHVPLGRAGTVDEVAGVAVFLASGLSSFVTGVTIPVEGGMLAAGGWLHHPTLGWTTDARSFGGVE
jgi:NAD(P)-dependent dehydrogenase (short-subunit alcohol dehydrogenase family)